MTLATLFAALVALGAFCIAVVLPSSDPDTYWHLASARWMVDHGQLLTRDPFSSTAAGVSYSVGEWGGELVWYAAYLAGGWQGIAILRAAVVAIAAFFTSKTVLLVQPRPAFATGPLLAVLAIGKTTWTDRPQLFTLALFAAFLYLLLRARSADAGRAAWVLPPLLLLWTNLHGGYAVGLALVALFALDAIARRSPQWRTLAAVLVVGAIASTLNPESFGPLGAAGHVTNPPRFIAEELPPDLFTPQGFTFALLLVAAITSAIVGGGRAVVWPLVLVPFVWLGLSAQRHLPLAAIPLAAFVAEAAPRAVSRAFAARAKVAAITREDRVARPIAVALVVLAGVGAASVGAVLAPRGPDDSAYPAAAIGALRAAPREVLNEYDWGGYLIWHAPERPVFIDGRLFLYLPDVFDDYRRLLDLRPDFGALLDERRIDTVLLRPERALSVYLKDSGWTVLGQGERFILLRRP